MFDKVRLSLIIIGQVIIFHYLYYMSSLSRLIVIIYKDLPIYKIY